MCEWDGERERGGARGRRKWEGDGNGWIQREEGAKGMGREWMRGVERGRGRVAGQNVKGGRRLEGVERGTVGAQVLGRLHDLLLKRTLSHLQAKT